MGAGVHEVRLSEHIASQHADPGLGLFLCFYLPVCHGYIAWGTHPQQL